MRDRVAEVLAQRASLDRGVAAAGVAASLFLHGSLVALAVYAALHQPPRMTVNTLKIRFTRMAAPPPMTVPVTPAAAKPIVPKIEPPKPQPITKTNPTKPVEKNTVPISPFGKSNKKGSENPAPPKPAPAIAPKEVAAGQTGVTGLEGGEFAYPLYIDRMNTLIGSHWYRAQVTGDVKTVVYFIIDRDGKIHDAAVETPSGNGAFDRAALRAVLETSPLPALPSAYSGVYLGVHLTFR